MLKYRQHLVEFIALKSPLSPVFEDKRPCRPSFLPTPSESRSGRPFMLVHGSGFTSEIASKVRHPFPEPQTFPDAPGTFLRSQLAVAGTRFGSAGAIFQRFQVRLQGACPRVAAIPHGS